MLTARKQLVQTLITIIRVINGTSVMIRNLRVTLINCELRLTKRYFVPHVLIVYEHVL